MKIVLQLHSYWAVLTLGILIFAVINAFTGLNKSKSYTSKDFRLNLYTLIFAQIQLFIGLAWYFMSPVYKQMKTIGMSATMKDGTLRKLVIEHPTMMILAIVLISIGFSKHKKQLTDHSTFLIIAIFYSIALVFILLMLPWSTWFTN